MLKRAWKDGYSIGDVMLVFFGMLTGAFSLSAAATMILYFPVNVGRAILESLVGHDRKIHEMYTVCPPNSAKSFG